MSHTKISKTDFRYPKYAKNAPKNAPPNASSEMSTPPPSEASKRLFGLLPIFINACLGFSGHIFRSVSEHLFFAASLGYFPNVSPDRSGVRKFLISIVVVEAIADNQFMPVELIPALNIAVK